MMFPPNLSDISLLLGIAAIILLILSELLSTYSGKKKILRNTAMTVSILFLITVAIRVAGIVLNQ